MAHKKPLFTDTTLEAIGDGKTHLLTGVDFEVVPVPNEYQHYQGEVANGIRFRLDGKIYMGLEDENDGYRSCMRSIQIVSGPPIKNKFRAVRVRAEMSSDARGYHDNDILQLVDVKNGEVILQVGTDKSDNYYPSFVHWFSPELMAVNAK